MYKKHAIFLLIALQSTHVVQKKNRIKSEYDISLIIESFAERSTYNKVKTCIILYLTKIKSFAMIP